MRSISDSHQCHCRITKPTIAAIYFIETTHIRFFGSTQSSLYLRLFSLFSVGTTPNLSVGLFFRIRSLLHWYGFLLSPCVCSLEIIVLFIMSSFVFIYVFFSFFFFFFVHSFYHSLCFSHSRFLFVIQIFDGFHTRNNTLTSFEVSKRQNNLFHYQWVFIERQISTWYNNIIFVFSSIFLLFFHHCFI